MARDPQQLRKTYESKLGKDLVAQLTDQQINIISKFYNSLSEKEQSTIDSKIFKGYNDSELHEMAKSFAEENSENTKKYEPADKFIDDTQERLDGELKGTSDGILNEIDKLIAEYQGKVDSVKKSSTKLKQNVKEKSSALAVIIGDTPQKEEELVGRDIDSRILELLGIQDAVDLNYSDYKSLLVEKMTADRMSDNEGDGGDSELLNNEYKRIKSSTGKFKVKSKKINVQSFVAKTKPSSPVVSVTPQLPPAEPPQEEVAQVIVPDRQSEDNTFAMIASKLEIIDGNVQETTAYLTRKDVSERKEKNAARKEAQDKAAAERENRTENRNIFGEIPKLLSSIVKPIKDALTGFFDTLKRIGFAIFIMELLRFLKDPAKYINNIIDWTNKQFKKLETSIENFVIDKMVIPMNGMIKGLNDTIGGFVDKINPILKKLSFLGIKAQLNKNDLKVPEINENNIRNGIALPQIDNVDKDFLNFGQKDRSGEGDKTGEASQGKPQETSQGKPQETSQGKPQETLMGEDRSQSTSSESASNTFDTIVSGEGGVNSVNRGNAGDTPGGAKAIFGKDLTEMTVGEIMDAQAREEVVAVGKYQIIPSTMKEFVNGSDVKRSDKFTEATQDKFKDYVVNVKRPSVGKYLRGETDDPTEAGQALAREFASVGLQYDETYRGNRMRRGQGLYDGDSAGNAASISPEEIIESLKKDRRQREKMPTQTTKPAPPSTEDQQQLKLQEQRKRTEELMKGDPRFTPQASVPTITPPVPKVASLTTIGGADSQGSQSPTSVAAGTQSQVIAFSAFDPNHMSQSTAIAAVYGVT